MLSPKKIAKGTSVPPLSNEATSGSGDAVSGLDGNTTNTFKGGSTSGGSDIANYIIIGALALVGYKLWK